MSLDGEMHGRWAFPGRCHWQGIHTWCFAPYAPPPSNVNENHFDRAGGNIILAGGKIILVGGKIVLAGGKIILAGGKIILAGQVGKLF